MATLIRGGTVVTAEHSFRADVLCADGKIKVTFTPKIENPQICAIEIIPQSGSETSAVTPTPAATAPPTPTDPTPAPTAPAPTTPTGPVVLQIDAGKVIGEFIPKFDPSKWEVVGEDLTIEELDQILASNPRGYTIDEVLAHLRTLK